MTIIELGRMGVKPDHKIMDESTPEGKVLPTAYKAVTALPGGPKNAHWGLEVENGSKVWGFFEWNSIEEHEAFAKKHGAEAVKDLPTVLTHGEFTKHVDVTPSPAQALKAPVTEITVAYFPADVSAEKKAEVSSRVQQFADKALSQCADVVSVSLGWGVQNDFPVRDAEDGQTGSLFIAFVGWASIDAHVRFTKTDAFKEHIGLIVTIEDMLKLSPFHVDCRSSEREV